MNFSRWLFVVLACGGLGVAAFAQSAIPDSIPVLSAVAPVYPPIARTANATGDVTTKVEMNRDGKVTSVESTSGHPLFRRSADEAARRWVFAPSAAHAKRTVTLIFFFRLAESDAPASEGTSVYYPPYKIEARAMKVVPVTTSTMPNNSLDRSGGSVFGILIGPAKVV